jgi:23S rRNA (pseudouridine1915-N3)-methyltransferase
MRISLFAVGRLKSGPERELTERYLDRFAKAGPAVGFELGKIVEINESRAGAAETRKREEAAQLEKVAADSVLVLLDERGKALDSPEFAGLLGSFRDVGRRDLVIAIGGPDGLDPSLRQKAEATLCFGRMTWPHQMVRMMLAEQLYRAVTILSGHPYHRA